MITAYLSHQNCLLHDSGAGHPECSSRLGAIADHLVAAGLWDVLDHIDAPEVEREHLLLAHSLEHIEGLDALLPKQGHHYVDPDTPLSPGSLLAAKRAAGAVVQAVKLVTNDSEYSSVRRAFCAVRPPGHHAEHSRAMGFCLFNNIAVGARYALHAMGIERLAVVDFDVHHGNGTEHIVRGDPDILFCSVFQHPFYPFTDLSSPPSNVVHTPLPAGTGGDAFKFAIEQTWLPRLRNFKPQLILISAGFDGSKYDPLANWLLDNEDYYWITRQIADIANEFAGGRIVSSLEGGYNLDHLGACVASHLQGLIES